MYYRNELGHYNINYPSRTKLTEQEERNMTQPPYRWEAIVDNHKFAYHSNYRPYKVSIHIAGSSIPETTIIWKQNE